MTNEGVIALRDSTRSFLQDIVWERPVAITLTLKQRLKQHKLDHYEASKNFRHFMNRLNRACFGNAVRRKSKRLKMVAVLEHSLIKRLHHHGVIERPSHIEFEKFNQLIQAHWAKTAWGYRTLDIKPMTSDGWISYITKLDTKPDYDLAIDWKIANI